ncbi:hypothetical protein D9611_015027 [Ephemerocybe angulata]|uniref:DUF6699 domain-containing protein n=1 Tax=Ephemerocybe angulata TaxID=980116 RepID=A0A8H5C9W7_9AGAR|nr:hypothetical protein D9611_015027 [Tulosesus angulatus]
MGDSQPQASTSKHQLTPTKGDISTSRPRWQQYGGFYRPVRDPSIPWVPSPPHSPMPLANAPVFEIDFNLKPGELSSIDSSPTSDWSFTLPPNVIQRPTVHDHGDPSLVPKRMSTMRRLVRRFTSRGRSRPSTSSPAPTAKGKMPMLDSLPDPQRSLRVQPHEWKAYGYWARPIVGNVQVHNSESPPQHFAPLQHIKDTSMTPEDVFDSLYSPRTGFHPERWKLGIEHPSLPPRATRWAPPDPTKPLPFPWEVQLNPFLEHVLFGVPRVYWDVREDVSAAQYGVNGSGDEGCRPLTPADFAQPASWPFLTHMYINALADDMAERFAWPLMVINPDGIKVRDVLNCVYANFREGVKADEYWGPHWTTARRKEAAKAHGRRTDVTAPENEWKALEGYVDPNDRMRRIDYLGQRTLFRGLGPNPDGTGWVLYLGQD